MCPRFYALVCATEWLWASCHIVFWSVISQEENDSTESTQRQSCRSVWWSAPETLLAGCIKYTYGAVSLQSATTWPPHQHPPPPRHWFLDWRDRFAWLIFHFISTEILYAGKYLKLPIYQTLTTVMALHFWSRMDVRKWTLCTGTLYTVDIGLGKSLWVCVGWNTLWINNISAFPTPSPKVSWVFVVQILYIYTALEKI